jgi:catechol-2,3-dioxygenase
MTANAYDRAAEDLGNIVNLGHVNLRVPDQRLATIFYVTALGLTRDPAMMTGVDNMWVNVGVSQFHLPTGPAVVAPGVVTGLVTPDLSALKARLSRARQALAGTRFDFREIEDGVEATCPWGNVARLHAPDEARFGRVDLGMAYVSFEIPRGRAAGIARFYREVMGALVVEDGGRVRVTAGDRQYLVFEERDAPAAPHPDHHIQIYLANFSAPWRALRGLGAEIEESNRWQYRFKTIHDVDTRAPLFVLDHETRAMTSPMFGRALVNRDPGQTARDYRVGGDFHRAGAH